MTTLWGIRGRWEVECPGMGSIGYDTHTMEVSASRHRAGREVYDRFDFGDLHRRLFDFRAEEKLWIVTSI